MGNIMLPIVAFWKQSLNIGCMVPETIISTNPDEAMGALADARLEGEGGVVRVRGGRARALYALLVRRRQALRLADSVVAPQLASSRTHSKSSFALKTYFA